MLPMVVPVYPLCTPLVGAQVALRSGGSIHTSLLCTPRVHAIYTPWVGGIQYLIHPMHPCIGVLIPPCTRGIIGTHTTPCTLCAPVPRVGIGWYSTPRGAVSTHAVSTHCAPTYAPCIPWYAYLHGYIPRYSHGCIPSPRRYESMYTTTYHRVHVVS
jgi:hypothetical protein